MLSNLIINHNLVIHAIPQPLVILTKSNHIIFKILLSHRSLRITTIFILFHNLIILTMTQPRHPYHTTMSSYLSCHNLVILTKSQTTSPVVYYNLIDLSIPQLHQPYRITSLTLPSPKPIAVTIPQPHHYYNTAASSSFPW